MRQEQSPSVSSAATFPKGKEQGQVHDQQFPGEGRGPGGVSRSLNLRRISPAGLLHPGLRRGAAYTRVRPIAEIETMTHDSGNG